MASPSGATLEPGCESKAASMCGSTRSRSDPSRAMSGASALVAIGVPRGPADLLVELAGVLREALGRLDLLLAGAEAADAVGFLAHAAEGVAQALGDADLG